MKVEAQLTVTDLKQIPAAVRRLEEVGYDGVASAEMAHDPFYPLVLAAEHTRRLELATAIAVAFPRSPMAVAYGAWDIQAFSGGRFLLGLGSQVKGHNERRFSVPWGPPAPRLREYILALRAIWDCWQNGAKLDFRGQHYTFTLMTPFFSPGPIEHPHVPVSISAVNPRMCRLAGELCDGVRLHPFSTLRYLREVALPNIAAGASAAGRSLGDLDLAGSPMVVTGRDRTEVQRAKGPVKRQIAFYASTRTYKPVMDVHGWGEVCLRLYRMSVEGRWEDMAGEISDEMLAEFAVVGTYDEVVPQLKARYGGILSRISFNPPRADGEDDERLKAMIRELKS